MRSIAIALIVLSTGQAMAEDAVWTRLIDPTEHAFSLEVPKGWIVNAGVRRRSPIQPHFTVGLQSPGGATQMLLGNIDTISYSIPTQLGAQLGFHEGSTYSPNGDTMIVLRYRSGQQWAEFYGRKVLGLGGCKDIQTVGTRNRPDAVKVMPQSGGPPFHATAGEAFFTCQKDDHDLESYFFSQTELTGDQNFGVWNADSTYGFVTPAGHGMAAGLFLSHIVGSVQIDQQWMAAQLKTSNQVVQHVLDRANATQNANTSSLNQTFGETQQDASNAQAEFGRLISGFDEYQTASGEKKTVPYGAATNWWSTNRGATAGTNSNLSPGTQFTPMTRVPPGQSDH